MSLQIKEMDTATESDYQKLIESIPGALLYHSLKYRNFLRQVLTPVQDRYLIAYEDGEPMAAIPAFIKQGPMGSVVNSLPFFGSNGSIISKQTCKDTTKMELLKAFNAMCSEEKALSSTIIQNPLAEDNAVFEGYEADYTDERIGQLTPLPLDYSVHELAELLMARFHSKTRNLIRKGIKSNFEMEHNGDLQCLKELYSLHVANMQAIGGIAKHWEVFEAINNNFIYDQDYRIYFAKQNQTVAAALLVFFFNGTAEYFTPAIHVQYRSQQPLSYLIYLAMQDACSKGCEWWNWGGTWLKQDGVYHFKSRWGTKNFNYRYFVKFYSNITKIEQKSKDSILSSYPNFYVLPFSKLKG